MVEVFVGVIIAHILDAGGVVVGVVVVRDVDVVVLV